jgi:hypothetical protein
MQSAAISASTSDFTKGDVVPIVRREGKVTIKAIEALDSDSIINMAMRGSPELDAIFDLINPGWIGSSKITSGEGAPNVILQEYEASPGAWLYDETETGITFVVFSDGWKKDPWKGSSIECVLNGADVSQLHVALGALVRHLVASSGYVGWLKHKELAKFVGAPASSPSTPSPTPGLG